jgi:hypothetical protein
LAAGECISGRLFSLGAARMEWLLFILLVGGVGYYLYNRSGNQPQAEVVQADTAPVPPPRPAMTLPTTGTISVAFEQTEDSVWVWIDLSETTKHILSDAKALDTPVDEFYLGDKSGELRQMLRDIDDLEETRFYTKRDKEDEKRKRTEQWNAPQYITLREILANPHRHYEPDPQRRLEYLDKLKNKILPKVKSIVEGHSQSKSGSFEL